MPTNVDRVAAITPTLTHISFSSILLYLHNRAAWQSKYLLGIKDQQTNPAALVGSAFHKYMELRLKGQKNDVALRAAENMVMLAHDVDWGKTGSVERSLEELHKLIVNITLEWPEFYEILGVEAGMTEKVKGVKLPIKAFVDLIYRDDDSTVHLLDWKTVRSYEDALLPNHILQAVYYYWVVRQSHPEWTPKYMHFAQLKASENKDGTPQVRALTLHYEEHPEYFKAIKELTNLTIREMSRKRQNYLINLRDSYEGQSEFDRFVSTFK